MMGVCLLCPAPGAAMVAFLFDLFAFLEDMCLGSGRHVAGRQHDVSGERHT